MKKDNINISSNNSERVLGNDNNLTKTNGVRAAAIASFWDLSVVFIDQLIRSTWSENFNNFSPVWRSNVNNQDSREVLLRHDDRGPNEIFTNGFRPRSELNAQSYIWQYCEYLAGYYNPESTPFISTTRPEVNAQGEILRFWLPGYLYRSQTYYTYEIFAPGGIDAVLSVGTGHTFSRQNEVTFPGGIDRRYIRSVREMRLSPNPATPDEVVQIYINPYFTGSSDLPAINIPEGTKVVMWEPNTSTNGLLEARDIYPDMMKKPGEVVSEPLAGKNDQYHIIPNGEYSIRNSLSDRLCLDLTGNSTGAQIKGFWYRNQNNQQWKFTYDFNKKAYKISSLKNSNLVLTWDTNSNGRIIKGYANNDNVDKYWRIEKTKEGFYKLRNLYDPAYCLDLKDSNTNENTVIQMSAFQTESEDVYSQQWRILPKINQEIPDGLYRLCNDSADGNRFVTLDDNKDAALLKAYLQNVSEYAVWYFTYYREKDAYKISSLKNSNLMMTASGDNIVRAYSNNNSDDKYWRVEHAQIGQGFVFTILNDLNKRLTMMNGGNSGRQLNVVSSSADPNRRLPAPSQKWLIKGVNYQPLDDGDYTIQSMENNKDVVDLTHNSDGSIIHAHNYTGGENQRWKFTYDDYRRTYKISSLQNLNLAMTWDTNSNDRIIRGYEYNDKFDKKWRLEQKTDGSYTVKNLYSLGNWMTIGEKNNFYGKKLSMINHTTDEAKQRWSIQKLISDAEVPNGIYVISTKSNYKKAIDYNERDWQLMIHDYQFLNTNEWRLKYYASKQAYKIYTKEYQNQGWYYQNSGFAVKVDNIDGYSDSDLRKYWQIEYNLEKGGYLFRSLFNKNQVIELKAGDLSNNTVIRTVDSDYSEKQIWNLMPQINKPKTMVDQFKK
ncbi:RICIN domain-containing protein [Lactiplantibacillus plantarum]|uniref:RICIN domain-containing protein n=1 Tax=Lactiplantibacillus plantarum TaxID=1590 RepID=UPI0029423CE7|nr:RICIN domain-containing protein [Lactiplantibacillus plantarum]WOI05859.1 RICIN domain-containing protein [Lactiplantibacillus plantarum]